MAEGVHVTLNGKDAASFRAAAAYILRSKCPRGTPVNNGTIDNVEVVLAEQNIAHLKEEGAFTSNPSIPANADHRPLSKLRSGIQIYVDIKAFCPVSEVVKIAQKECPPCPASVPSRPAHRQPENTDTAARPVNIAKRPAKRPIPETKKPAKEIEVEMP